MLSACLRRKESPGQRAGLFVSSGKAPRVNPVALQFAGGAAFFYGIIVLVLAAVAGMLIRHGPAGWCVRVPLAAGLVLVGLSSTPLSYWFYAVWAGAVLWLLFQRRPHYRSACRRTYVAGGLVILLSVGAAAWELPYHSMPAPAAGDLSRLIVLGDSISGGIGDGTVTWPRLLERERGLDVVTWSVGGWRMADALDRAQKLKPAESGRTVVVLELGGVDVLESTPVGKFEQDLDALLAAAARTKATVLLMEVPLPPFHNRYGRAQRTLASKHGAVLVPKRCFASVLSGADATVDGLHLSQRGQERMARLVWRVISREP